MLHSDNFNFSFSGLKTAVRYDYESRDEKLRKSEQYVNAMSYAAQEAIITVLVTKTLKAAKQHNAKTVMLAGGVAANKPLKETLKKELSEKLPDANLIVPEPKLATDNGAMIAVAGYLHYKKGERSNTEKLNAESGKLITEKF